MSKKTNSPFYTDPKDIKTNLIDDLVSNFKKNHDYTVLKQQLKESSSKVFTCLARPKQDQQNIKKSLEELQAKVGSDNSQKLAFYQELLKIKEDVYNKPLSTDGRWYSYEEVNENLQTLYLFSQFLGELNNNFDEII